MRLLTAIPFLFWASTAAFAHLAVLWATEPAAAVTHAPSQESALESTWPDALHPVNTAPVHPVAAIALVLRCAEQMATPQAIQAVPDVSPSIRILAASLLLANPPPAGV